MRAFFILLYVCLLVSCQNENKNQQNSTSVEISLKTSEKASIWANLDLFDSEKKQQKDRYQIESTKTVVIPLIETHQIVGLEFYPSYYEQYIFEKGDKIIIDLKDEQLTVSKLFDGKKQTIPNLKQQLVFDVNAFKNYQNLKNNLIQKVNKHQTVNNEELADFIHFNEAYYEKLRENIENNYKNEGFRNVLTKFSTVQQYQSLMDLNAKNKSKVLSNTLNSEVYLNESNLNDRVLSKIFESYNHSTIFKRPRNKPLTEKYDADFNAFSKPVAAYFKRLLLIGMIDDKYDRKVIGKYIDDYEKNFGNHFMIDSLKKEIEYGVSESEDLLLKGVDNKPETWKTLMQKWKGKTIYVDFWASWCSPCIGELPYSKKLKSEFKDVVFIYLALNDNEEPWRKAIKKYDVASNNYLIINSKSSKFIADFKIESIPRYMILDKNGKIVNPNAPRPSSENIKVALKEI